MDFTGWTCQQLSAFIADPASDPIDRATAQSLYDSQCGTGGTGTGGQSGGGGHIRPPS